MLQLSCTQKPASHDRQNGSKRCHGKGDFGMKVAMIGHKDFPSRSGGVEVMVGGRAGPPHLYLSEGVAECHGLFVPGHL